MYLRYTLLRHGRMDLPQAILDIMSLTSERKYQIE